MLLEVRPFENLRAKNILPHCVDLCQGLRSFSVDSHIRFYVNTKHFYFYSFISIVELEIRDCQRLASTRIPLTRIGVWGLEK